jgi:hypothetical protein
VPAQTIGTRCTMARGSAHHDNVSFNDKHKHL